MLRDGAWIPGVRVESASFSLTLPAPLNAYTTAVTAGRASDIVAIVMNRPLRPEDDVYLDALPHPSWTAMAPDVRIGSDMDTLPAPASDAPLSPDWGESVTSVEEGIEQARAVAERAHVPASSFPVGALLECADGTLIPGANVEHPDWSRILCAERCAIGTARSYDVQPGSRLFLTCLHAAKGTPCGACRQWIAELTPEAVLWMDRHQRPPTSARIETLLPGSFRGHALLS